MLNESNDLQPSHLILLRSSAFSCLTVNATFGPNNPLISHNQLKQLFLELDFFPGNLKQISLPILVTEATFTNKLFWHFRTPLKN